MTKADLQFLVCCCSAFLPERKPPKNEATGTTEKGYYELLGVSETATYDEIRKAYRKRSLEFHPDKIAQRRGTPNEVNVQDFQKIKEAYETLMNPRKRDIYDVMGPRAMPYVMNPSSIEAQTLAENLARATCCDRLKVVLGICLLWCVLLIQPILICLKVDGHLESEDLHITWYLLMIPTWLLNALSLCLLIRMAVVTRKLEKQEQEEAETPADVSQTPKSTIIELVAAFTKFFCIVASEVLLVLKFDDVLSLPYYLLFVPVYVYEIIRLGHAVWVFGVENRKVAKMVTIQTIEEEMGGRSYSDLTPEERDEINQRYIIVHTPPNTTSPHDEDIHEDLKDMVNQLDIMQSPEFQYSHKRITASYGEATSVFFHALFLGLLIPNLDATQLDWSWWLVFLPLWVRFCCLCTTSCYQICFRGPTGAPVLDEEEQEEEEGDEEEGDEINIAYSRVSKTSNDMKADIDDIISGFGTGGGLPVHTGVSADAPNDDVKLMVAAKSGGGDSADDSRKTSPNLSVIVDVEHERQSSITNMSRTSGSPLDMEDEEEEEDEAEDYDGMYEGFEGEEDTSFAIEETMKAVGTCCSVFFYIVVTCLFVAKLEGDRFSSFWVIFPILLLVGLLICSSGCGIMCFRDADLLKNPSEQPSGDTYNNDDDDDDDDTGVNIITQEPDKAHTTTHTAAPVPERIDEIASEMEDLD